MAQLEISILGRSPFTKMANQGQAIRNSIAMAQLADRLGYSRYWLTEHHSCLLDSCPEVLLPLLAATTQHIKVGTAGILLTYYQPYKVAKTFQFLSTMFPGRIDMGVCGGRLSGTALEGLGSSEESGFNERNERLIHYLELIREQLSPIERSGSIPQHWIAGSGWNSMHLAARLGASYCYSLCHSQSAADPSILSSFRTQIEHQNYIGLMPESAILVAGVCADSTAEAVSMAEENKNVFFVPTVAGTPSTCAEELHRLAEVYSASHVVWMDLSPAQEQAERSLTLLSGVLRLRETQISCA